MNKTYASTKFSRIQQELSERNITIRQLSITQPYLGVKRGYVLGYEGQFKVWTTLAEIDRDVISGAYNPLGFRNIASVVVVNQIQFPTFDESPNNLPDLQTWANSSDLVNVVQSIDTSRARAIFKYAEMLLLNFGCDRYRIQTEINKKTGKANTERDICIAIVRLFMEIIINSNTKHKNSCFTLYSRIQFEYFNRLDREVIG